MRRCTLRFPVAGADPDWLLAQVADFERFAAHHPYMIKVETRSPPGAQPVELVVHERLRLLGCIPQRPRYAVQVSHPPGQPVRYHARLPGGMRLDIDWTVDAADPAGPALIEEITLAGLRPLTWLFLRVLRAAHGQTFARLAAAAPAGAAP